MDPLRADPMKLHPQEQAQVADAVDKRRREYAAGRLLAHSLLHELGADSCVPLINGADRAPQWPAGVVGSITHCMGWCAVAAASAAVSRGIGIDIEPAQPLPEGTATLVLTAAEHDGLARLPPALRAHAERLVFSAKEAAYKALYPSTRTFLDFPDLQVELDTDGGFVATPTRAAAIATGPIRGRYRVTGEYLATAVVLPPV
ncbi:MAG TPA: 4'-phosphopantetheinyl transferase superfamily protein [Lysobacter sp.]|nr:4'-phosphopantetheinyl transferase superfamily protein [Lysobacter sp.]